MQKQPSPIIDDPDAPLNEHRERGEQVRDAEIDRIEELCALAKGYYARNGALPTGTGLDAIARAEAAEKERADLRMHLARALTRWTPTCPGDQGAWDDCNDLLRANPPSTESEESK